MFYSRIAVLLLGALPLCSGAEQRGAAPVAARFADPRPIVIAHRGCWLPAPEDSLAALEECIRLGVDAMELDVRRTRDGEFVILHDDSVDRMTNGKGQDADMSLAQIKQLKLRGGLGGEEASLTQERIPTLQELLRVAKGRIMILLDIKSPDDQAHILRKVEEEGAAAWIIPIF